MTLNLRLVIPGLFEPHMLSVMEPAARALHDMMSDQLLKADHQRNNVSDIYQSLYQLGPEHMHYVPWSTALPEGISSPCLRADPVILQATHNGIVCRGNDILHLAQDEQEEITALFNDYFKERGLHIRFISSSQGLVELEDPSLCDIDVSPLANILGQDITHHLPSGPAGREWQTILMETQMLLARSECNIMRTEQGEKTVGSLWFWGRCDHPAKTPVLSRTALFSDHPVLLNAFPDKAKAVPEFPELLSLKGDVDIVTAELERFCLQNDVSSWQSAMTHAIENLVLPAIDALSNRQLKSLELVSESDQYLLSPWHKLRFWR